MRDIKTLLQLMLDNKVLFNDSLCILAFTMKMREIINQDEYMKITRYIENNRPFNLRTLFKMPYHWTPYNIKPRIKWLKKHIKKNTIESDISLELKSEMNTDVITPH